MEKQQAPQPRVSLARQRNLERIEQWEQARDREWAALLFPAPPPRIVRQQ